MAKSDAVSAVTGEIFREGWSRVRGSTQGLGEKRKQMTRAAKGHRAAVFKAIRSGGTHTKGQLSNQLEYLTSKSSFIVDSRSVLDGKKQLSADEIKSVVDRFSSRWDEGFRPKMGHTTHMLMSFPVGTKGADVRDIASAVAERFFANDERNFDYLIAVHEDRAHPHAHMVLNRRSQEGEYFYLGRDHHFNYDDFRTAMVEEAEKFGVRLEATRRIDRGVLTYAPKAEEIYAAKEEGREPKARERVGRDLDRALAEIATTSRIYRSLAAEASAENREDISNALILASEMLGQGGQLEQNGEVYMETQESFDDLRSRFAERAERVEQFVRDAPDAMKAKYEKQLDAIYRNVAHMQPVGVRSATLNDAASDTGVYSEANINKNAVASMREPDTRAQIETALRGTGISSSAVIARVEQGASNAWLEQRWMADDLSKIAKNEGLNLERKEDLAIAAEKLDQVHVQLGQTLERVEVLRDDGVIEVDALADLDVNSPEYQEFLREEAERQDSVEHAAEDNRLVAGIERAEREGITIQDREDAISESVTAEVARLRGQGYSNAHIAERSFDIEDAVTRRIDDNPELVGVSPDDRRAFEAMEDRFAKTDFNYGYSDDSDAREYGREQVKVANGDFKAFAAKSATHAALASRAWDRATDIIRPPEGYVRESDRIVVEQRVVASPEIARVIEHERNDKINSPFSDDRSREIYRGEIERELNDERLEELRNGDSEALSELIDNRLDRLYAAKAYLQSDEATSSSEATREVVSEIAEEEYDAQRLKHVHANSEKGQTHG
jgi:type IV secretion system T-DNA border endonuclease VirD2